jgi:hypothetical protein
MGVVAKTIVGARLKLYINGKLAGIFGSVDVNVSYGVEPISILGNYGSVELVYTSMAPVTINATGFRVFQNGPYAIASVPQLQDLLTHQDIQLTLVDRQNPSLNLMVINSVRPTGWSSDVGARGLQGLTVNFLGLTMFDEGSPNGQQDAGGTVFG